MKPREWWIRSDVGAFHDWIAIDSDPKDSDGIHVIEYSEYERLQNECWDINVQAGHYRVEIDKLTPLLNVIADQEKRIDELKAENWVLRDTNLRTYDGLTDKADKYDETVAKLTIAREALEKISGVTVTGLDQGSSYKDIVDAEVVDIAKEALDKIK